MMKYIRFRDSAGFARRGEFTGETIRHGGNEYTIDDVTVLQPVEPSKVIAVGTNHESAIEERSLDPPAEQRLFFKPPHTFVGPGDTITLLPDTEQIVYEAELGVVIGEQCKNVSREDAWDVVEGYTCVNDISNLDDRDVDPGGVRVKGFDNAAAIGPVVATPDEVAEDALIELFLNGEKKQSAPRSELLFTIPEIIEEITSYLTLNAGDVIATGTPAGLGKLSDGDTVVVEIEGIGQLENHVEAPTN